MPKYRLTLQNEHGIEQTVDFDSGERSYVEGDELDYHGRSWLIMEKSIGTAADGSEVEHLLCWPGSSD